MFSTKYFCYSREHVWCTQGTNLENNQNQPSFYVSCICALCTPIMLPQVTKILFGENVSERKLSETAFGNPLTPIQRPVD